MQKLSLFLFLWVLFAGCSNNTDPVNRPYIISQSQEEPEEEFD
jgi:hypothetical protein